jgi:uncharacterized membrane protein
MNSRLAKIALIVSLVVNVFIIGGAAGAAYMWLSMDRDVHTPGGGRPGLRAAARELPPERRRAFRESVRQTRRDLAAPVAEAREGRREVLRLLAAPEFDRAAIDAAFVRARNADAAIRARLEDSVITFAQTLSPEERKIFAEGLRHRGPLRQQQKKGGGPKQK